MASQVAARPAVRLNPRPAACDIQPIQPFTLINPSQASPHPVIVSAHSNHRGRPMRTLLLLSLAWVATSYASADECPDDPNKTLPGECGCGQEDLDPDLDGVFDTCIHPTAAVSAGATIGGGVTIGAFASIGAAVIDSGAIIGSRAHVGDGSQVGAGSVLARRSDVGDNTILPSTVVLARSATIGNDVSQAAGSAGTLTISYGGTIQDGVTLPRNGTVGALVQIGADAIVEEWATLARSSSLGANAHVGEAVVGPEVTISAGTVIEDGVRIRKFATVDANARLMSEARIGRSAAIGEGAIVESDAVLRAQTSVCDWTTVPSGTYIARTESWCPPRTYPTWDPNTASSNLVLSNGDRTATHNGGWAHARATVGRSSGRWYWEVTGNGDYHFTPGMIHESQSMPHPANQWTSQLPTAFVAYTFNSEGRWIRSNGVNLLRLPTYTSNTPIGFAVDLDTQEVWVTYNGIWVNGVDPSAGDPGLFSLPMGGTWYPTTDGERGIQDTVNFGQSPFVGTPPAGFAPGWF